MKKLLFLLFIAVLLGSCQGEFDNVNYTITNESSKTVKFSFYDDSKSLNNSESITYNISSAQGRFAPQEIDFSGHKKSVNLNMVNNGTAGIFYTFTDNAPLTLNVENKLSIPVTVKADDFIDNKGKLTIEIKEGENETALIYTSTPNFSVNDERTSDLEQAKTVHIPYPYPYPITADWELIENTINLTIK